MSDRPTPETDAEAEKLDFKVDLNFARKLERERDEARELVRNLYSTAYELRRFAAAYANDYYEVDGKEGALNAISDFYDASKNIAKILGEEAAK